MLQESIVSEQGVQGPIVCSFVSPGGGSRLLCLVVFTVAKENHGVGTL